MDSPKIISVQRPASSYLSQNPAHISLPFTLWSFRKSLSRVVARQLSVASRVSGLSWHSHTVMQCHPILDSRTCTSLSRSWFLTIFFTQNSRLLFGTLQHSELAISRLIASPSLTPVPPPAISSMASRCPCQKHPFTKIQVLYLLSTKSGFPGNRKWFNRYRYPCPQRNRRTINSGRVSLPRIAAIFIRRCSFDNLSAINYSAFIISSISLPVK